MEKDVIKIFFMFMLILNLSFISANFEVGNLSHLIDKGYSSGETIKGWANISLNNEPSNSLFNDSFGNSISLINLIKKNTEFQKTCIPTDCEQDYSVVTGTDETEKDFGLDSGDFRILGFKFSGSDFSSVSDFSMKVASDALESDTPQLYIDILNDGTTEWKSYNASGNFQEKIYGCYSSSDIEGQADITQTRYCEKIRIPAAPNVEIGAYIIENTGGSVVFEMNIYNATDSEYSSCEASGSATGEISCVSDFKINKEKEFFVCINAKNSADDGNYTINYETKSPCGFAGSSDFDFEIFAKPGKYSSVGSFTLNNTEIANSGKSSFSIEDNITSYIYEKYENDCTEGCIVPVKFTSGVNNQEINIFDIDISYNAGIEVTIDKIYDAIETPAKISAGFQKIYLDGGGFSVPEIFGNYTFLLNLNNTEIFNEKITVEKIPVIKNLEPRTTASAYPTKFKVIIDLLDPNVTITKYEWDFGNKSNETTTTNTVTHTYSSVGNYKLKITVTDSKKRIFSKTFDITVGLPEEIIKKFLTKMEKDLSEIKTQIRLFDSFYQAGLNSALDITTLESRLADIQKKYATNDSTEENLNRIMTELLDLKIPESIAQSKSADSILFYPEEENINLDILKEVGGGDYKASDEDKYINAIFSWHQENIESKVTFKEISARYEYSEEPVLRFFELKINEKNDLEYNSYLILQKLDELRFKDSDLGNEKSGYVYITLEPMNTIVFSTTEDVEFVNLPAFISPDLKKLVIEEGIDIPSWKISKQMLFILIIVLLFIIGFITYIILQEWYRKKYENYLFKNKNNLYNLVTYIKNTKNRGMKEGEITNKLKKAGWNSEQIRYAVKKHSGKRTGMFEIPLRKILNMFKKKNIQSAPQGKTPK